MVKHKVYVKRQRRNLGDKSAALMVRRCVLAVLVAERIDTSCEVSVLLTDAKHIHELNREHRAVDAPTDVLSFPMFEFQPGGFKAEPDMIDLELDRIPLGDIVVSVTAVEEQAERFGHGESRELAYLTVHSTLHLLGYDHMIGEDKRVMRQREEEILELLDFRR